ncbi:MAG: hypothetical protein EOO27_11625 [Comamonadaceae bacterium]|nr:MAG: hypothetical protein EOO27_11625 [Comamonadaceae bacterium]
MASKHWDKDPIDLLLGALRKYTKSHATGFVVAALDPPRLWHIAEEAVYERTDRGEAWEGDKEPYDAFKQLYDPWPGTCDVDFRLMSSMQGLTSGPHAQHPSVGGHAIHIQTTAHGFQYAPDGSSTFEPTSGNDIFFSEQHVAGYGTTPGAFAVFIPGRQHQLLFLDQQPWEPVEIKATTMRQLVAEAFTQYKQEIAAAQDQFGSEE